MFYLEDTLRSSSPWGSISNNPAKTATRKPRGNLPWCGHSHKKKLKRLLLIKLGISKLRNLVLFCVWEDGKRLGSLKALLWYILQPCGVGFFTFWVSSSSAPLLVAVLDGRYSVFASWLPSGPVTGGVAAVTDGCNILCLRIWQASILFFNGKELFPQTHF